MRVRNLTGLFMSLLVVATAGCGGGGGGGGGAASVATASGTLVKGTATKGPVAGGSVKVFEIVSSATLNPRANIPRYSGTALAQGSTASDGSYSVPLPAGFTKGSVMIQITGGSYTDESTGGSRNLDDQYGPNGMRAIFSNISGLVKRGEALNASVTPYTELAYQDAGQNPTDDGISHSNGKIAAAFNLPDIVRTRPLDPNSAFPASGSDDAKKYALALATISQYQKDFGAGASMAQISAALTAELAGSGISVETSSRMGASSNNYASGSHNPNPELETPSGNPSAAATIHLIAPSSATSVPIGSQVTVTVLVEKGDQAVVPDGTLVNFASSFGTLSAGSAATAAGIASVTLTSATVGSATVTVGCGAVTATIPALPAISFFDPNAPAGITLSASAGTGVTGGAPVLISASVSRSAGGPVPDGTAVSFAVTSGTGTLSGATATSGGIATVNLSSGSAGPVGVRASAGGLVQLLSVPFITQPTQAIVKVSTGGTLPAGALIGGINATLNYASGKGLGLTPTAALSGVSAGSLLASNANGAGQVVLGIINTSGIALGEFATLTFTIAAGNFPTAADFSIASGSSAIDVNTANIAGVGATISSVTIQ